MQSDTAEKRLFNCAIKVIDYYFPVRPPMPTKSVSFWLVQLNPLVGLFLNPDRTKSENLNDNCSKSNSNMSNRVGNEEFVTEEELVTEEKLMPEKEIVTKEELMTEEELVTEEKLEIEKKIETEDLEGLE